MRNAWCDMRHAEMRICLWRTDMQDLKWVGKKKMRANNSLILTKKIFLGAAINLLFGFPAIAKDPDYRKIAVEAYLATSRLGVTKAEFVVEAPPATVWRTVLDDIDRWTEFVPNVLFCKLISKEKADLLLSQKPKSFNEAKELAAENLSLEKRIIKIGPNETSQFKLIYLNLPWPVANRWILQKEIDHFDPALGSYTRSYKMVLGNVVSSEGSWAARPHPQNPKWSIVNHGDSYNADLPVPGFIYKPAARSTTRAMLEAIRKRAEAYVKK